MIEIQFNLETKRAGSPHVVESSKDCCCFCQRVILPKVLLGRVKVNCSVVSNEFWDSITIIPPTAAVPAYLVDVKSKRIFSATCRTVATLSDPVTVSGAGTARRAGIL